MRVLGVDPGSLVTGFGVIEGEGSRLIHVASGGIRTQASTGLPARLKTIYDGLEDVIARWHPDIAAVENIFHSHNVQSALKLGHARGVALLALVNGALDPAEYLPMEVKKSVVGQGHADKEQVRRMVQVLLNHRCERGYDASDALAVAICHYYSHRTHQRLDAQRQDQRHARVMRAEPRHPRGRRRKR